MKGKFCVPYETAQALKAKGYPQDTDYYWMLRGKEEPHGITLHDKLDYEDDGVVATFISAPTFHEVIDWLESKGIRVFAHYYLDNGKWVYVIEDFKRLQDNAGFFNTREEALNAAILKALELI